MTALPGGLDGGAALAAFNALCNAAAAVLLVAGFRAVRRGEIERHRRLMLAATAVSVLFLASYLTRMGVYGSRHFMGEGATRVAYLLILASHSLLAALNLPLVLRTLFLGLRERFPSHRRVARWTFPIWAYVSVTGVVVYLMLYHL